MTPSQSEKAQVFQALHARAKAFVIANPWDPASTRILAALGFEALTTSSGAAAGLLGRRDGQITRDEAFEQIRGIVQATHLPVAADLEKGFGDSPEAVAQTIRLAAQAGLVGASIEDATGDPAKPLFELNHSIERIAAAAEAARSLPFPFMLVARTENYLRGKPDLDNTLRKLQAFEQAGADVLFSPGLPDLQAVRTVCSSLGKPFNFMVGIRGKSFSVAELEAAGVRRISLATSLFRAAMTGLVDAAREVREQGTFNYIDRTMLTQEFYGYLKD